MRMRDRTGVSTDNMAINKDPVSSAVANTGLAIPPVLKLDVVRASTAVDCTEPATVPPTIVARHHFINGLISGRNAAVSIIPATMDAGEASVSNRLSNQGM